MRCPKCHTETPNGAANCPGCNLATPKGKQDKVRARELEYERKTRKVFLSGLSFGRKQSDKKKDEPSRVQTIVRIVVIVVAIGLAGFGSYLLVFTIWDSKKADPVLALKSMEQFRAMPSNEDGLTVDELMKQELKKFKDSGNLKGTQGWHTQAISGTDSRVLVVFSFQDGEGQDHRAEWLVDVKSQRYIPQTALAIETYNK